MNRLKHDRDEVVRRVDEFTQARFKVTECLSVVTDVGPLKTRDSYRKPNKINKNGRSAKYIHTGKSPGEMSQQTNRPIQTHYFKFKFQNQISVSQYATWL